LIDDSLDVLNGRSKLFVMDNLKEFKIQKSEDLLLLFLPNFWMQTPFEFLLIRNAYDLLEIHLDEVDKFFADFLQNENCMNKICDMFIYILENRTTSKKKELEDNYCQIFKDEDSDNDGENDDNKKTHNDMEAKIKGYYNEIIKEINKNSAYSQNNDFDFTPLVFQ
jgi:hypothetical protein